VHYHSNYCFHNYHNRTAYSSPKVGRWNKPNVRVLWFIIFLYVVVHARLIEIPPINKKIKVDNDNAVTLRPPGNTFFYRNQKRNHRPFRSVKNSENQKNKNPSSLSSRCVKIVNAKPPSPRDCHSSSLLPYAAYRAFAVRTSRAANRRQAAAVAPAAAVSGGFASPSSTAVWCVLFFVFLARARRRGVSERSAYAAAAAAATPHRRPTTASCSAQPDTKERDANSVCPPVRRQFVRGRRPVCFPSVCSARVQHRFASIRPFVRTLCAFSIFSRIISRARPFSPHSRRFDKCIRPSIRFSVS